jgi:hypothetical protein
MVTDAALPRVARGPALTGCPVLTDRDVEVSVVLPRVSARADPAHRPPAIAVPTPSVTARSPILPMYADAYCGS